MTTLPEKGKGSRGVVSVGKLCRDLRGSDMATSGPERPWWSVDCSPSSRTLEKPHLTVARDLHYTTAGKKYSSRIALTSSMCSTRWVEVWGTGAWGGGMPAMASPPLVTGAATSLCRLGGNRSCWSTIGRLRLPLGIPLQSDRSEPSTHRWGP
jgi:hypothetical protein